MTSYSANPPTRPDAAPRRACERNATLPQSLQRLRVDNNELVHADHLSAALTAGTLVFGDGATQVFTADGHTTYIDQGRPSQGEWWVRDDGTFVSFWPPDYRATYVVRWVVAEGAISGLTFTESERGARFEGHYL